MYSDCGEREHRNGLRRSGTTADHGAKPSHSTARITTTTNKNRDDPIAAPVLNFGGSTLGG
eukprot:3371677-Rhodomonas_salina.1